jgi:hypothetical protein
MRDGHVLALLAPRGPAVTSAQPQRPHSRVAHLPPAEAPAPDVTRRPFQDLFHGTERFSKGTRRRLERAIGGVLIGGRTSAFTMRNAVGSATRELLAEGLDPVATLAVLSALVEAAGRAGTADRTSLISGQPTWVPVRSRVLASAETELLLLAPGAVSASPHHSPAGVA